MLHRRPYQENISLVQFLTMEHGLITVLARQSAKLVGKNFQQFVPMLLTCSKGAELYNLRNLDLQEKCLLSKPESMMLGIYVNEIVIRLVPKQIPSRRLFQLYVNTIAGLVETDKAERILRNFEVNILEISGHGMQLAQTYDTYTDLDPQEEYTYDPSNGAFLYHSDNDTGLPTCSGKTLLALKAGLPNADNQVTSEARKVMRFVMEYHLRGRDVNTRSIFEYLQSLA